MRFADDPLYSENMQSLIIPAAPYGPTWLPGRFPLDIPITWNAGTVVPHIHRTGTGPYRAAAQRRTRARLATLDTRVRNVAPL